MISIMNCQAVVLTMFYGAISAVQVSAADAGAAKPTPKPTPEQIDTLVQHDPVGFLEMCLQHGPPTVQDFGCVFVQNEVLHKELPGKQVIQALYQREPRSVYFKWIENPQGAKRMLWVKGRDLTKDGKEQVRLEPSGAADFVVKDVLLKMNDHRIVKHERQPITAFGSAAFLQRIVRENRKAKEAGHLGLKYHGKATFDGRPTYMFIRQLPYAGAQGPYSDARMVLHVDQEWLIPLSISSSADDKQQNLLERDEFTQMQVNVGLSDADFRF